MEERLSKKLNRWAKKGFSLVWNKQFFTFLVFLFISFAFWVFTNLNETYKQEFEFPIKLVNVPENVVITTNIPKSLHVSLRDKGFNLLNVARSKGDNPIQINFSDYTDNSGRGIVSPAELAKLLSQRLPQGMQIITQRPQQVEFYFNYGERKRVPVVVNGTFEAADPFYVMQVRHVPDSVTVYAARNQLSAIRAAQTVPLRLTGLTDNTKKAVSFQTAPGMKFVPEKINLNIIVDRLVEKTVQVPVQQVNFPASKTLRTFPSSVSVTFQVGMHLYRFVNADQFVLVVNYESLLENRSSRCHLSLKSVPPGVRHVRISPQDVDYVIEDNPDSDNNGNSH
ncbi:YbbR-like domain-containing protein [Alloprevotella tannerae]|uniref:YbbR-like domain-containing protein n=1 Tax=Alloprevotella tannerae TaxID=76122 RepID=UPI00288BB3A7|nr:YbbR-like domain-containing protein [Alloprevotella tannerae]